MSTMVHRGAQREQVQRGGASCSGRVQVTQMHSAAPRADACRHLWLTQQLWCTIGSAPVHHGAPCRELHLPR